MMRWLHFIKIWRCITKTNHVLSDYNEVEDVTFRMNHYYLAFDVGGLFIKGIVLNKRGEAWLETETFYSSKCNADRETLLQHFVDVVGRQVSKIMDKYYVIDGIGFAFPGPFDYEQGISYINGLDKFEALYGVDLRKELTERLRSNKAYSSRVGERCPIVFENNANLFAIGEWEIGLAKCYERSICLTLGNGIGSAFVAQGQLVNSSPDVPMNGWVYCRPFQDSIVDDYISTRGILRLAKQVELHTFTTVEELAHSAQSGQVDAIRVFAQYGQWLGEMLRPYVMSFRPAAIILGGQIAKAFSLFAESMRAALGTEQVEIKLSTNTSFSTYYGIYTIIQKKLISCK